MVDPFRDTVGKMRRELESLHTENEKLRAELEDRKSTDDEGFEVVQALMEANQKLRELLMQVTTISRCHLIDNGHGKRWHVIYPPEGWLKEVLELRRSEQ